jgi:nitrite reductase/ring-hydroxylating ferredoxin subunit
MTDNVNWVQAAKLADVPECEMLGVNLEGQKVALYHLEDGEIHASANICTHEYALLSDGWLEGCEVECPLHAGRFDIRSGKGLCHPIERDLAVYDVEVRDGLIFVALPSK